jgi:hypothetical protein
MYIYMYIHTYIHRLTTEAAEQIFKRARDRVFSTRLNGEDCNDIDNTIQSNDHNKNNNTNISKNKNMKIKNEKYRDDNETNDVIDIHDNISNKKSDKKGSSSIVDLTTSIDNEVVDNLNLKKKRKSVTVDDKDLDIDRVDSDSNTTGMCIYMYTSLYVYTYICIHIYIFHIYLFIPNTYT